MASKLGLVLDCGDPDKLAEFWSAAIETPTVEEEAARLESLGARRIKDEAIEEHGNRWVVMADIEGNEFCACNAGHP